MRAGDACASIAIGVETDPIAESTSDSSSTRPSISAAADFSFSRRTSRPLLWQYHSTNMSTVFQYQQQLASSVVKNKVNFHLQNRATLQMTFVPMNAGHLSLSAFMIALSMPTTALGFVTNSDIFFGINNFIAWSLIPP